MKNSLTVVVVVATWLQGTLALPQYADQIPNGKSVPNPNPPGGIWAGVGHENAGGGGTLNLFGEDFRSNQYSWTNELCQADSDGDGRTNGAELGDPDCVWFAGGPEPKEPSLSHPGIDDEPQEAAPASSCAEYVEPDEIIKYDIEFTVPVVINETRTHYRCEQIERAPPSPQLLHKVKESVLLDNTGILHHMFVFFCFEESLDGNRVGEGPYECSGNESRCVRAAGWALGPGETCLPSHIGEEYDFTGMETVVVKIEAHYDNTAGTSQQDQSGISIILTPDLRPISAAKTIVGTLVADNNFEIPAQLESYTLTNICPGEATLTLPHPIYVFSFFPHMHYFGHTLYTEHYRCGVKIGEIGRINAYEFDNQQGYLLAEPVKVLPGDALITTCEYNTLTTNVSLVGGEESTNEMCLNFVGYYPAMEDGFFRPCSAFENGVATERLTGTQGSLDPAKLTIVSDKRFAIAGQSKVLFDFESDPSKNWAPCCDTNSCEEEFLATTGGVCGLDGDCTGDLVCLGGFCTKPEKDPAPAPDAGQDENSSGHCYVSYVGILAGTTSILFLQWFLL